jgi:hypothetical protein
MGLDKIPALAGEKSVPSPFCINERNSFDELHEK